MRIRYAIILGGMAVLFVVLAVAAAQGVLAAYDTMFNAWPDEGVTSGEAAQIQERQETAQAQVSALLPLVGWSVLAASIALVGVAILLSLRDQRGSASATASRDASTAASRS